RDRWESQQERLKTERGTKWLATWTDEGKGRHKPEESLAQAIDAEVKKKLVEGVNRRRLQPSSLPPDEDNLASLAHRLLVECAGGGGYTLERIGRPGRKRGPAPTYHLVAREQRADGVIVTTGVTFVCAASGHGSRAPLQRMAEDTKPPDHRV